ncbi:hypothetical protein CRENBAI_010281 [Crenichthys baileyi]|uniref:Uncharacterized protein n=1 Tax=Crenichthys baileyi TaxID=28760 RepID=A0AAV9RDK8_9TELE
MYLQQLILCISCPYGALFLPSQQRRVELPGSMGRDSSTITSASVTASISSTATFRRILLFPSLLAADNAIIQTFPLLFWTVQLTPPLQYQRVQLMPSVDIFTFPVTTSSSGCRQCRWYKTTTTSRCRHPRTPEPTPHHL